MATTVTSVGLSLDVRMFGEVVISNGVDIERKIVQLGKYGIPGITYAVDDVTINDADIDFIASGETTITGGDTATLDFATIVALDGAIIDPSVVGAVIKYAAICLKTPTPNDAYNFLVTRNSDALAVPFGLSPIGASQAFRRHFLFCEPVHGATGTKILLVNNGGVDLVLAWIIAGTRGS